MQNWSYYGRSLAPCVSTVHLPDVTACDQISRHICILQVIKTRDGNSLATRLGDCLIQCAMDHSFDPGLLFWFVI